MSKMKLSYKILTFDGNNYWGENGGFLKTTNYNHFERDLNSFNFKNIQFKANDNEFRLYLFIKTFDGKLITPNSLSLALN
jgi:hypothetical protein